MACLLLIFGIIGDEEIFTEQIPGIRVTRIIITMVFVSIAIIMMDSGIIQQEPTISTGTITSVNFAMVAVRNVSVPIKTTATVVRIPIKHMTMVIMRTL